jgi:hypothetical protein
MDPGEPDTLSDNNKDTIFETVHASFRRYCFGMSIRGFCRCIACFHLVLCITYIALLFAQEMNGLVPRMVTPVTQSFGLFMNKTEIENRPAAKHNASNFEHLTDSCQLADARNSRSPKYVVETLTMDYGELDTRITIILFHFLSFLFQFLNSWDETAYMSVLKKGNGNVSHFIEYSISASLMIISICAQLGVTDIFIIVNVFGNSWACMMFGFFAEIFYDESPSSGVSFHMKGVEYHITNFWIAHVAGWISLAFAMSAVYSNLGLVILCTDMPSKVPGFVWAMVAVESFLFLCFGFVQLFEFIYKPFTSDDKNYKLRVKWALRTEYIYITLSASAKVLLGAIIYIGNYTFES